MNQLSKRIIYLDKDVVSKNISEEHLKDASSIDGEGCSGGQESPGGSVDDPIRSRHASHVPWELRVGGREGDR